MIFTTPSEPRNATEKRSKGRTTSTAYSPFLCTDKSVGAKEALLVCKHQSLFEKRFERLGVVHMAASILFRKIERAQPMTLLFFMALAIQSAMEHKVRRSEKVGKIGALPLHPENRLAYHPATAKIFEQFHDITAYCLMVDGTEKEYRDKLKDIQKEILDVLGMTEKEHWSGLGPQEQN